MTREKAIETVRRCCPRISDSKCDFESAMRVLVPGLCESEDENLKNRSGYYKAGKFWKASTLWNAVKGKSPQKVPNRYILQECTWNISSLQHFADEVKNVQEVNLDYPIILDMNGNILDGAHRVVKAYLEDKDIDIVYLGDDEWPEPDYDEEKAVKKSEDEMVRKMLISLVKHHSDVLEQAYEKDMLAWLEKQKEKAAIPDELVKHYKEFCEKSGNDGMMLIDVLNACQRLKDLPTNEEMLRTLRAEYEKGVADTIAKYEQKEQKPAEWDKLQAEFRSINEAFEDGKKEVVDNPKKYGLCKSAEWSEEDDGVLGQIITAFHRIANGCEHYFSQDTARVFEEKLKSLRTRWNPSEEQMKALKAVIDSPTQYQCIVSKLKTLYDELKKL